jgi:hypothetical protein
MKKVTNIKAYAERLPFMMVLFSAICYLCSQTKVYFYGYQLLQNIGDVSLLFCFFMLAYSDKWGFVAKKSIYTLISLNVLNIINEYFVIENYYFYFIMSIYLCFTALFIYSFIDEKIHRLIYSYFKGKP